ncbi:hypothetical protein [Natrarchaeobius chitinivorans]|uniref:Uncharacterized protein n=1 Tax=Natrarchaeobius chitinivorans TaxID=1679083 RepID=A0A3N6PGT2_NATCH|nr:hypothetical protein [Natrarchaeobius chitinivorans]RQG97025.1 hypothetical protein EA473_02795 [Natrarchaeobius chitinivorans]
MPSSEPPRRRLLASGIGALSALIAGCTGTDAVESGTTVEHEASEGTGPYPGQSDEFDLFTLRSTDDETFVYPRDDPPEAADDERTKRPRRPTFVLDEDDAADLVIASDDEPEARAFLAETDFDSESIVVEQRSIDDCYRRHLLSVRADPDRFRTRYCQTLKRPTTPCEADLELMEALFIRVSHAYDESPSSRGSGESMSCPNSVDETDGADNEDGTSDPVEEGDFDGTGDSDEKNESADGDGGDR